MTGFGEVADLAVDYGVPVITGLAGYFIGGKMFGGDGKLATALSPVIGSTISVTRLVGLVFAAIFGIAGMALWRLGKRDDIWYAILGKGLGGFFLGTGASYLVNDTILNQGFGAGNTGIFDSLIGSAQSIAGGN
jgi:hypothetical protein